ncbi:hypothetical protein FRB95_005296 [Tulasnella sp. JGI-2019a]|nr:hypothetical protein FRB95_005296 [Tulasnella sp. JGI-2019a]
MVPLRAAVLGTGFSAKIFQIPYILALPDHWKLHSIFERRATDTYSVAREHWGNTGVKVVNTLEGVLGDKDVDVVVVAVKDPQHFEFTKKALEAGKHVILEKPIVATSAEARELIDIAKAKGLTLAPYHNRRFDGDFLTVQKLLKEGKVRVITSGY